MKRTEPKAGNMLPSSSKNVRLETEKFDSLTEVAELKEKLRLATLKNNVLKKHIETLNKFGNVCYELPVAHHTTPKTNIEKRNCRCQGNCRIRVCGCIKRNIECNLLCKCDIKCQNRKMVYNENKENIDITGNQSRKKNKTPEPSNSDRDLFSPDTRESYKNFELRQFNDVNFNFNKVIESSSPDLHRFTQIKDTKLVKEGKEQDSTKKVMHVMVPMNLKHQLSQTPPKKFEEPVKIENETPSPFQERVRSPLKDLYIVKEKID